MPSFSKFVALLPSICDNWEHLQTGD